MPTPKPSLPPTRAHRQVWLQSQIECLRLVHAEHPVAEYYPSAEQNGVPANLPVVAPWWTFCPPPPPVEPILNFRCASQSHLWNEE
eukprot:434358-Pyramimonas_sp.AAC.1